MSVQMKSAIKLEDAFFCLSCELVTNSSDLCPACGHRHLWPLENWIGRVDACENSRYKCILEKALPERAAEISRMPSRRNYWQLVRNCGRKSLESITGYERAPEK